MQMVTFPAGRSVALKLAYVISSLHILQSLLDYIVIYWSVFFISALQFVVLM